MTQLDYYLEEAVGPHAPRFAEALEWFRQKLAMPRPEFDRLAAEEKARAFTVAHLFAAEELDRAYRACEEAIAAGSSLEDFRNRMARLPLSDWHVETVFRTNVLSAYGAGHWDRAQQTAEYYPYARYSAIMDGRTRPSHARLHGLVYPLNHPFWQSYWPPWDYNCRCGVVLLSQAEVDARGLQVGGVPPDGLPEPSRDFVSPARGWRSLMRAGRFHPAIARALQEAVSALER